MPHAIRSIRQSKKFHTAPNQWTPVPDINGSMLVLWNLENVFFLEGNRQCYYIYIYIFICSIGI